MTQKEIARRANDENVKIIKDKICDCKGDKDYVFISYKSDDWEIVLQDIVYRLVNDYGLNVYFDGSFDSHNSSWITQFTTNMFSERCKGVIAFFDNKYATSYAAMMELMFSQTKEYPLPVVPIDLEKLTSIESEEDTGLGVGEREDGIINSLAQQEKKLFSYMLNDLKGKGVLKEHMLIWRIDNMHNGRLNVKDCNKIVRAIRSYKEVNDNHYTSGMSLDGIAKTIRDACGHTVFNDDETNNSLDTVEPKENSFDDECESATKDGNPNGIKKETVNIAADEEEHKVDSEKGNHSKSKREYVYSIFGGEEHTTENQGELMFDAFEALIKRYPECAEKLTQRTSVARAEDVRAPGTKDTYPTYFRGYKDFVINGQKYLVGTSYGFNEKIAEIKGMFKICGADASEFVLNGEPLLSGKKSDKKTKQNDENSAFEFELWGVLHSSGSMAGMMHDVFDLIAEKYPNRNSDMADEDSITSVARKDDVDSGKLPPSKMNYFNTKKEHSVNGTLYYVSTRYNREQGIGQLKKMLTLCEGSSEEFRITSAPKKSTHNVNKSVKKTLVEAINE